MRKGKRISIQFDLSEDEYHYLISLWEEEGRTKECDTVGKFVRKLIVDECFDWELESLLDD